MNVFVVDVAKCNGCHNCQIACKDEHCGVEWSPYAKPQPLTGQFWMRVDERVRGSVPVVKISYTPVMCNHCDDAPCMAAARDGAMYRRSDGLVVIDPEKAVGQRQIVDACPLHAVYWNEELSLPQKCTGCAHLLDDGWQVPRCVDACPTEALRFGSEEELEGCLADAHALDDVEAFGPRVLYLNLPKRFLAGALVDFEADEVVIGANVNVLDGEGAVVRSASSDEMGDFYIDGLEPGIYTVKIDMPGYEGLSRDVDLVARDLNLGDLAFAPLP